MADPTKSEGKDDTFNKLVFIFLGLYLLWFMITRLNLILITYGPGSYGDIWETFVHAFFKNVWPVIKLLAVVISVICIWGIYHVYKNFRKIVEDEKALYGSGSDKDVYVSEEASPINPKWVQIQSHIDSKNPSEWRVAIIEADIMLDELLKSTGYHGETVGDRLKAVEKSDFLTLESAWEAHKVRNQIAHQGNDFEINEREARRVISLFESVFREFKII